jgi:hypothetical protein
MSKTRLYYEAILDIWYNFFGPHRPQFALWGLIVLGLYTSINTAWKVSELGAGMGLTIFIFV